MTKRTIFAIVTLLLFLIGFVFFVNYNITDEKDNTIEIIDSIKHKKDSIITVIDKEIEIIDSIVIKHNSEFISEPKNKEYYEKIVDDNFNDSNELELFFSDRYRYLCE